VSELSTELAISRLAVEGERAGFTLEQMIALLEAGVSVVSLLDLITLKLEDRWSHAISCCPGWIV